MLSYIVSGEGEEAVIWLHGLHGSGRDWDDVCRRLPAGYRHIQVDLPGHGASLDVDDAYWHFNGISAGLVELMEAEHVAKANVVGYSMGGRLALWVALHDPAHWRRLVLVSASPGLPDEADRAIRKEWDEEWAERFEKKMLDEVLADWYAMPLFDSLRLHPAFEAMLMRRCENQPAGIARALRTLGTGQQPGLWERIDQLAIPVAAIVGSWDAKYVRIANAMTQRKPDLHTTIIPDAGHAVHLEQPAALANEIATFLTTK